MILREKQGEIIDKYFSVIEKKFKQKGKTIPRQLVDPKIRYILERQMNFLQKGRYELLPSYFTNDVKLMTNFALPGRSIRHKAMLTVIKRIELFAVIETEIILDSILNFVSIDNFSEIFKITSPH